MTSLDDEGRLLATRLAKANAQRAEVIDAAREYARRAHAAGMTEAELARLLSVDRGKTMRRWLGKD